MSWRGAENRRFPRANFTCKIVIHTPKERTITAKTENIGAGGLRVIIAEGLEISSMIGLELYLDDKPISCKGRVVWMVIKKDPESGEAIRYDTGIEFYQISHKDQAEIKKLVNSIISNQK